jgi:hypothetical protein
MAKVRSGIVDSFRTELSEETQQYLEDEMRRILQPDLFERYVKSP